MKLQKILTNIFSNWTNLCVTILLAFFVSPIVVHQLGNELYGIWSLVVSVTGYFTILNFGVNTAVIRYVSRDVAQKNFEKANSVYNTAFVFFFLVSLFVVAAVAILAFFFPIMFKIKGLTRPYLYGIFFLSGLDIAINLLFSVFPSTLKALQEFFKLNIIELTSRIVQNGLLILLLFKGYRLLTLVSLQLAINFLRYTVYYFTLRSNYPVFLINRKFYSPKTLKLIYSYSIYSFIIAIASKILFFTDAIVIGARLAVDDIPFYTIPATLIEYVQKFVLAIIAVLIPLISSHEAVGATDKNKALYITGTRYILILSAPVLFSLFTVGNDFIRIWMGAEYGMRCQSVLRILLCGYICSFPQLLASGILEGISRHKILAYALLIEAFSNLGISIALAPHYGISGVAIGTALPLIFVNLVILPAYTCSLLDIRLWVYFTETYARPVGASLIFVTLYALFPISIDSYTHLAIYSVSIVFLWSGVAFLTMVEPEHRQLMLHALRTVTRRSPSA